MRPSCNFVIDQIEKIRTCRPTILCFELTETATIGNLAKAQDFMRTLPESWMPVRARRLRNGRQFFAYLKDLRSTYLKDRRQLRSRFGSECTLRLHDQGLAQLAKVMCMETIAEYVETTICA